MNDTNVDSAIVVKNLCKSYPTPNGALAVLDDINFRVSPSESVAIVGVSGSGKSTLLALLAGLDQASMGSIQLHGEELCGASENQLADLRKRLVGFVFQQFHLLPNLNALENVALALELRGDLAAQEKASQALTQVGLAARQDHFPRQLSGGEQQRVALARAYCAQPKILFADEPTGNLDANTARAVTDLLFQLNEETGATLILVTHDEKLAARCRRGFTLANGRIATS